MLITLTLEGKTFLEVLQIWISQGFNLMAGYVVSRTNGNVQNFQNQI